MRGGARRLGAFGQAGLPGVAWVRRDCAWCWVPALRQAQGRLCAGMTGWGRSEVREVRSEMKNRERGEEWDRTGEGM